MHQRLTRQSPLHIVLAAFLVALAVVPVACATATTGRSNNDDDDETEDPTTSNVSTSSSNGSSATSAGSGGGVGGGGASSAQSSSSKAAQASSSSSSGGGPCDNTGDCPTCGSCALDPGGPCESIFNDCLDDFDCSGLLDCFINCPDGDTICEDNCASTYQAGIPLYNAVGECVICGACPNDCDGMLSCP